MQEENRRFRVKFAPMAPSFTALEACRNCMTTLAPLIPIREMTAVPSSMEDSQMMYEDSQPLAQTQPEAACGSLQYQTGAAVPALATISESSQQRPQQCSEDGTPQANEAMSVPDIAKVCLCEVRGKDV